MMMLIVPAPRTVGAAGPPTGWPGVPVLVIDDVAGDPTAAEAIMREVRSLDGVDAGEPGSTGATGSVGAGDRRRS